MKWKFQSNGASASPGAVTEPLVEVLLGIQHPVEVPADLVRIPLDGVIVKASDRVTAGLKEPPVCWLLGQAEPWCSVPCTTSMPLIHSTMSISPPAAQPP